ncbi:MAG: DUF5329 family protein [Flavobacteriales bacterium]
MSGICLWNNFAVVILFFVIGCADEPKPSALQLPEQGLSIKLEQRNSTTITRIPSELRIEIGDITRGQTMLTVWNGAEVLMRESIHEKESYPFTWNNEKLRIECVQLDNELIGPDFGYFKLSGNQNSTLEPSPQSNSGISEKDKILQLIEIVEQSDIIFIRNGEEHNAQEAAAHLRRKYEYAGSDIQTAEQFITNIASRSSSTGEAYRVKLKDGSLVDAEAWFRERLRESQ